VAAARRVLETEGWDAVTMRRLADKVGIRAPSLYKHIVDKAALEVALITEALVEMGEVLHAAVARPGRQGTVAALLAAYRRHSVANPDIYRLATSGPLPRGSLTPGLEDWAGEPFFLATGDPAKAQALWSFAHGMVILEIDGRYPDGSDLDATWRAGAKAFGA
jgi:AcrR family transcriptional regulator